MKEYHAIKPLVSIIIPVYNTENYVRVAIESVLSQSYKNIELILVDDGSTDRSGEICDDYGKRDSRIRIIHQENSGVACARNTGIAHARGELIQFLDSDDEIHEKKTEILVNTILEEHADIAFCGIGVMGNDNKEFRGLESSYKVPEFIYLANIDASLRLLISSSCACILKRDIITKYDIYFNDEFLVGEDCLFILNYLSKCEKVYVKNEILYYYKRYKASDRVSITSYLSSDVYQLFIMNYKETLKIIEEHLSVAEKSILSQKFFDRLIPSLMNFIIYQSYSKKDILIELKEIISCKEVHQSSLLYRRRNKEHSKWIPIFIRLKLPRLLYIVLVIRGKKQIRLYGKYQYVNSIYWKNNVSKK